MFGRNTWWSNRHGKTLEITYGSGERREVQEYGPWKLERKACLRNSLFLEEQREGKEKIIILREEGLMFYPRKGFGTRAQDPRRNDCVVCLKQF